MHIRSGWVDTSRLDAAAAGAKAAVNCCCVWPRSKTEMEARDWVALGFDAGVGQSETKGSRLVAWLVTRRMSRRKKGKGREGDGIERKREPAFHVCWQLDSKEAMDWNWFTQHKCVKHVATFPSAMQCFSKMSAGQSYAFFTVFTWTYVDRAEVVWMSEWF